MTMTCDESADGRRQAPKSETEAASGPVSSFPSGMVLVDKPAGITSFRVVQWVRRATGIKKVGHAGTLDPFATGLLVVCIGRPATRRIDGLMAGDKEYLATLRLGIETDSFDLEGTVTAETVVPALQRGQVEDCLAGFVGPQLQRPPAFSALKHQGKPLYHYARQGIQVEKEPRPVSIHELELLAFEPERLAIRVRCSKGTYIRALAADIGRALGCGAHLEALRRTRSGTFSVQDAVAGDRLADRHLARQLLAEALIGLEAFPGEGAGEISGDLQ